MHLDEASVRALVADSETLDPQTAPAALTDNSGGTSSATLAAITDTPTKNAVASLNHQINLLIAALKAAGALTT